MELGPRGVASRGHGPSSSFEKKKKEKKINKYSLIFNIFGPYSLKFLALPIRNFDLLMLLQCGGINLLGFIYIDWFFVKRSIICGETEMN